MNSVRKPSVDDSRLPLRKAQTIEAHPAIRMSLTRNAPKGRFPFAVAFTLADGSDVADKIPPQGSRGWLEGYLGKPAK